MCIWVLQDGLLHKVLNVELYGARSTYLLTYMRYDSKVNEGLIYFTHEEFESDLES